MEKAFLFPIVSLPLHFLVVIPNIDALTLAAWIWKKLGALESVVEEAVCGVHWSYFLRAALYQQITFDINFLCHSSFLSYT